MYSFRRLLPLIPLGIAAALADARDALAAVENLAPAELIDSPQSPTAIRNPRALEFEDVRKFFDEYLATQMNVNHIAGAAVAVVQNGATLFKRGYGFSDVARGTPVDPDRTVFVLGSLSKVFTATAVMQLVERGMLDLGEDANVYLDFRLPATYGEPITLNHLLSHTTGFEDRIFGQMAPPAVAPAPLDVWLRTHVPARIREPGRLSAYANYGTTLAGYIVERAAATDFNEYIESRILAPLNMTRTTSRQPLPEVLRGDLSQGYVHVNGTFRAKPEHMVVAQVAPAGAFHSTASDMARFMMAHLNFGDVDGSRILQPQTLELMQSPSYGPADHANGIAHGFWQLDRNGQRILAHAGSHFLFNSVLMLFPERRLGVFVCTNTIGGNAILGANYLAFVKAFTDRFFPKKLPVLAPIADFPKRAAQIAGSYTLSMGRAETTAEKLRSLMSTVEIRADDTGLLVSTPGGVARFTEFEPFGFRDTAEDTRLVFRQNGSGAVVAGFLSSAPLTALLRCPWYEIPVFNAALVIACLLSFVSFLIAAPFRARLRSRAGAVSEVGCARSARAAAVVASLVGVLFFAGVGATLFDIYGMYVGRAPLWPYVRITSVVEAGLAGVVTVFCAMSWVKRQFTLVQRIHYVLVWASTLASVGFMLVWELLGKGL